MGLIQRRYIMKALVVVTLVVAALWIVWRAIVDLLNTAIEAANIT